ncbi:hypothetical protein J132_04484 [Termitomyces sp. J132]|nr:hypothetical protein J132_04484 [Termitomyces sp. J132]
MAEVVRWWEEWLANKAASGWLGVLCESFSSPLPIGRLKEEFFPPVVMPVIPHTPWVLKNITIAPGLSNKICQMIKQKIEAGVYEPSNPSYRSQWFTVLKKDGESLRIVHSLEPLNKVTIAHSGLPPATEKLASHFAGRACGGIFDLRFVWEHLQNVNRVLQRIKYAGGTFSGKKSVVCADEIVVVGHRLDTSWMAVGFGIFQEAPDNPKQCTCAKLGSITLNEREARFSQPKRELYGLMRALQANKYWLVGCRKLVVETDAKYLKGMLSNPGVGPNATIIRWIEDVLLYHFTLRHVPGKTFSVDGLSRRLKQLGDEEYLPVNFEQELDRARQALFKACEDCTKWFCFFFHVMWSDCITIWQRFGCSPYFMVTGAHPTLPLDLVEATWLMELSEGPLSTEELIGHHARALAKHHQHVEEMRERVGKDKLQWALKFAEEHKNSIKDFNFKPLDLVLVKNMITESSDSAKMLPCFHGPMVVIAKTRGGNYIVAELDGSAWQTSVAAFRVVPYKAQR